MASNEKELDALRQELTDEALVLARIALMARADEDAGRRTGLPFDAYALIAKSSSDFYD